MHLVWLCSGTATCGFDRPSLTMHCEESPSRSSFTTTWPSIEAAVSENRPIGLTTASSASSSFSGDAETCAISYEVLRDELGRLTATRAPTTRGACNATVVDYDAWDPDGRPTHGTETGVDRNACVGRDLTLVYDDTNRSIAATRSGGTNCEPRSVITTFYDERGIIFATEVAGDTITSDVLETAEICLD